VLWVICESSQYNTRFVGPLGATRVTRNPFEFFSASYRKYKDVYVKSLNERIKYD
jgi:hypothetical protein